MPRVERRHVGRLEVLAGFAAELLPGFVGLEGDEGGDASGGVGASGSGGRWSVSTILIASERVNRIPGCSAERRAL